MDAPSSLNPNTPAWFPAQIQMSHNIDPARADDGQIASKNKKKPPTCLLEYLVRYFSALHKKHLDRMKYLDAVADAKVEVVDEAWYEVERKADRKAAAKRKTDRRTSCKAGVDKAASNWISRKAKDEQKRKNQRMRAAKNKRM
jgi:hypothetical protein